MNPGLSLDALDALVFGLDSRRRAFWRVSRTGQSPDRVHRRRGFSLVDRLGSLPGYEGTVAVYRSSVWRLLQRRLLDRDELLTIRSELLDAFGLHQPDQFEFALNRYGVAEVPYAVEVSPQQFVESLISFAPTMSFDWLALLCVYYRLAVEEVDLALALELQKAIRVYYRGILETLEIGRFGLQGSDEFAFLVERRVLRGDMSAGPSESAMRRAQWVMKIVDDRHQDAAEPARTTKSDRRRREMLLRVAIQFTHHEDQPLAAVLPRSEATRYFDDHRGKLEAKIADAVVERLEIAAAHPADTK